MSFLSNPAIQDLLVELGLVDYDLSFPDLLTIRRKLEGFLEVENKTVCEELFAKLFFLA